MSNDWVVEMQMQEAEEAEEAKAEWIRERLDDPEADEYADGWYKLEEEYEGYLYEQAFLQDYYGTSYSQDDWGVVGKSRFQIFNEVIESSREIISLPVGHTTYKNLLVMVYGHVIAAVEAYLSSTFIDMIISSESLLRKLVESDPEFAKRKFTMTEIFNKQEELKEDVTTYLKDLVFHKIEKIKPMYKHVLGIDFGDVRWLFEAVLLRHHCVHRAGYDKDGNEVGLNQEKIQSLINCCSTLVSSIEEAKNTRPVEKSFFSET